MFSPKSNYTNEQSISTIMRLYDLQNKPKSTPTPSVSGRTNNGAEILCKLSAEIISC